MGREHVAVFQMIPENMKTINGSDEKKISCASHAGEGLGPSKKRGMSCPKYPPPPPSDSTPPGESYDRLSVMSNLILVTILALRSVTL